MKPGALDRSRGGMAVSTTTTTTTTTTSNTIGVAVIRGGEEVRIRRRISCLLPCTTRLDDLFPLFLLLLPYT